MSVTFTVPDAPRLRVVCPSCVLDRVYGLGHQHNDGRTTCDRTCSGFTWESEAPELNVANINARALLAVLGLDAEELNGTLAHSTLPDLLRATVRVLNPQAAEALAVPASESGGVGRCRVLSCGTPASYITDRVAKLQALFVYAVERGFDVHYG